MPRYEHTNEDETPEIILGRNGLQRIRQNLINRSYLYGFGNDFMEENIVMILNIEEKKVLYAFGCSDHKNTIARLKYLTSMAVDPEVKHMLLGLVRKVEYERNEERYEEFHYQLRKEMDGYFKARWKLWSVESNRDWEESLEVETL